MWHFLTSARVGTDPSKLRQAWPALQAAHTHLLEGGRNAWELRGSQKEGQKKGILKNGVTAPGLHPSVPRIQLSAYPLSAREQIRHKVSGLKEQPAPSLQPPWTHSGRHTLNKLLFDIY